MYILLYALLLTGNDNEISDYQYWFKKLFNLELVNLSPANHCVIFSSRFFGI